MNPTVLVLNCGSSSIKFAIIDAEHGQSLLSGLAENLGAADSRLSVKAQGEKTRYSLAAHSDHRQALARISEVLAEQPALQSTLVAVGHRVVHGGEAFKAAVLIDPSVKDGIQAHASMAPLHNPANLQGILSAEAAFPQLPQVAVFDTAFFQSMPAKAYLYALPYALYQQHGLRRYGFHGSSHAYVSAEAARLLEKPLSACNLITAHLGNGCSITAIHQGQAVDTSLGFTPLEGLVMGTRSGDVDPSLVLHLQRALGYSAEQVNTLLNKESGLLGLSGLSHDCRTLEQQAEAGHAQAALALQVFCYRLAKYIAGYLVASGPLDALVFTGGIGENSAFIRQQTVALLAPLGFGLDEANNQQMRFGQAGRIEAPNRPCIWVIPTDEEAVIAQEAVRLAGQAKQGWEANR